MRADQEREARAFTAGALFGITRDRLNMPEPDRDWFVGSYDAWIAEGEPLQVGLEPLGPNAPEPLRAAETDGPPVAFVQFQYVFETHFNVAPILWGLDQRGNLWHCNPDEPENGWAMYAAPVAPK